jgi:5-methylcytosine-specific restriction protein A
MGICAALVQAFVQAFVQMVALPGTAREEFGKSGKSDDEPGDELGHFNPSRPQPPLQTSALGIEQHHKRETLMTKKGSKGPAVRTLQSRVNTLKPAIASSRHGARRPMNRRDIEQRRKYLHKNPMCCKCTAAGVVRAAVACDHITPLSAGGDDTWLNFQSLCKDCHDEKTIKDLRGEHQVERYHQEPPDGYTLA